MKRQQTDLNVVMATATVSAGRGSVTSDRCLRRHAHLHRSWTVNHIKEIESDEWAKPNSRNMSRIGSFANVFACFNRRSISADDVPVQTAIKETTLVDSTKENLKQNRSVVYPQRSHKAKGHVHPRETNIKSLTDSRETTSATQYEEVDECPFDKDLHSSELFATTTSENLPPLVPPVRLYRNQRTFSEELRAMAKYGWYWGPLSRSEARQRLEQQPNGSFLVRDSCSSYHLLSLSYRINNHTYHTRINYCNGFYSLFNSSSYDLFPSVIDLLEYSLKVSEYGVLCYFVPPGIAAVESVPVRLCFPVSRFDCVRSLQSICRFVVRQNIRWDMIDRLPLPESLTKFLADRNY